ncbi:hypothetical protein CTI14_62965, partial [Methylobacterium radiotolerans]
MTGTGGRFEERVLYQGDPWVRLDTLPCAFARTVIVRVNAEHRPEPIPDGRARGAAAPDGPRVTGTGGRFEERVLYQGDPWVRLDTLP